MTKRSRAEERYLNALKKRYSKAKKKERGQILDEYVKTTGLHRTHAAEVLSGRYQSKPRPWTRRRGRYYTEADHHALWEVAEWFDQIGSKRLRAALDVELPRLRAQGELRVNKQVYEHLLQMSPATMDRVRVLIPVKQRILHGGTKPGSMLKSQIPIRTYADWDDKRVGFVEIDLVQHEGSDTRGIFACTLNMTDVCTGWTEVMAVRNKAQTHVFAALKEIQRRLPFSLLGVDSDNGGEFINAQLIRYCHREHLTFTRGRVAHKNDNAFVEQKNWSVVRRLVGYERYDTPRQVKLLNQIYSIYRLYINFYIPITKLVSKEHREKRTIKIYDRPCTPYQRVLNSSEVSDSVKKNLRQQYENLNMLNLKRQIDSLKQALMRSIL